MKRLTIADLPAPCHETPPPLWAVRYAGPLRRSDELEDCDARHGHAGSMAALLSDHMRAVAVDLLEQAERCRDGAARCEDFGLCADCLQTAAEKLVGWEGGAS